ncbi:MAG: dTDP-4-dehydrorhamnose 3,5-epimerase family protein [Akkermansiaceae bacterium]
MIQGLYILTSRPSQIYVSEGVAHGFATIESPASIIYLVSSPWAPENGQVLLLNDPSLKIPWPLTSPTLLDREQQGLPLDSLDL